MARKQTTLVDRIAELHGPASVRINSPYHVTVFVGGKSNDLWFSKFGLKWRLAGNQRTSHGNDDKFLREIGTPPQTDVDRMKSALEMCEMVGGFARALAKVSVDRAVYCDAGLRDGKATIGVLLVDGENVQAIRRIVSAESIDVAEREAVIAGLQLADSIDSTITVYTDSQSTANGFSSPRVVWIPREKNHAADKLAHQRGKR